jgi:hypothetical protein
MRKLRTFAVAALAAGTVSIGALTIAPTASAMPAECQKLSIKARAYGDTGTVLYSLGNYVLSAYYFGLSVAYHEMATDCIRNAP